MPVQTFIAPRGNPIIETKFSSYFDKAVPLWVSVRSANSRFPVRPPLPDIGVLTETYPKTGRMSAAGQYAKLGLQPPMAGWDRVNPSAPPNFDYEQIDYKSLNDPNIYWANAALAAATIVLVGGIFFLGAAATASATAAVPTGATGGILTAEEIARLAVIDATIASGRGLTVTEIGMLFQTGSSSTTGFAPALVVPDLLSALFRDGQAPPGLQITLLFNFPKWTAGFPSFNNSGFGEYSAVETVSGLYIEYEASGPIVANLTHFGDLTLPTGSGRIFLPDQTTTINSGNTIALDVISAPAQGFNNIDIYGRFYANP